MTNARDLASRLADLLRREHDALAEFLVAVAEFDRERGWMELGYSSLFWFLHRELGLSKGAAHYRKTAAELVQRCPAIVDPLRNGQLCLTSVVELAKVLTAENQDDVLPRFFHLSRREAMEVTAELRPVEAPARRDVVTAVPDAKVVPVPADAGERRVPARVAALDASSSEGGVGWPTLCVPTLGPAAPCAPTAHETELARFDPPRDEIQPLTADLRRLHVTVSKGFLEKLEAAKDALSHALPGATSEQILGAALDLLLAEHAKRKGRTQKPRREPPPTASPDHVPAHVKRAVWARDGGKCQWPVDGGGICGCTRRLELDHVRPKAQGGATTIENLRVLCRFHNTLSARRAFGDDWMDGFTAEAKKPRQESTTAAR